MKWLVTLGILWTSSCASVVIHQNDIVSTTLKQERGHTFFVLGGFPEADVLNLSELCPQGWNHLRSEVDGGPVLLHLFTLGLVSRWSTKAYCEEPLPKSDKPL